MAFTFGAPAQQQPAQPQPQTSSLFGATPASSSTSQSPFGSFGSTQQQQQQQQQPAQATATAAPATSLFGSAPAASTSTGGLFGTGTAAGTQQPAKTGTGLFGSTTSQPAQSGGLFGSNTQQQAPAQGGGLFGSTAGAPAAAPAQGTGLFGSTPTGAGTGAAPSTSLFGQTQQTQQNQPAQSGGLFGSTAAQPQSTGLFGSTTAQPQSTGLFGSTSAQPQSTGMFGSTAQQQQQQQQQQQPQQQQQQPSLFASTSAPLSSSTLNPSPFGARQEQDIESRIMSIQRAWDVNSPECQFKYFFYNVVEPGTAHQYGRPAGAIDDAKWARAVRDNPDSNSMVPVLATGWGDVKKRVQAQEQTASVHQQRVKEINQALANLSRQSSLSSSVRLAALQNQLAQLTQRLLRVAALSPSFAPVQSSAFRPEEGEMKETLENVKNQLDGRARAQRHGGGGGMGIAAPPRAPNRGRMLGQINELWGLVEEVRRQRKARGGESRDAWTGDEKLIAEIAVVLEQQQTALQKLSQLATDALFDADVMRQGLGLVEGSK